MALPDLESLRCFETAAVRLNFRAAAKAVALSPAAFGDRIKRLEDQLGATLFHRTTRRVSLSPSGEALLSQARRTLEEARQCLATASGGRMPFELTVGTRFELGLSWLTPSLQKLTRTHPERTLHLSFGDSDALLARIRNGSVDCAVLSVRLSSGEFRYALLHAEDYALVAAPKLLRRNPLRKSTDASAHVLLDLHPDLPLFRYLLDARPAGQLWDFERVDYLGTIGAVRFRALEAAGVAVLPRYFIRHDLRRRHLVEPLSRIRLLSDRFRLVWRRGHVREAQMRELADELLGVALR
jgi:LysR family transcriptional regulator, glycine cleavage system transcriptional activator